MKSFPFLKLILSVFIIVSFALLLLAMDRTRIPLPKTHHPQATGKRIDLATANRIREEVYAQTDVAGSEDLLAKYNHARPAELRAMFDEDEGGVWCGGASQLLAGTYREKGIEAYSLGYGFRGEFTHAVTLVRLEDGELYLQDAYFNYAYKEPFLEVLDGLKQRKLPTVIEGTKQYRDVHIHSKDKERYTVLHPNAPCQPCDDHEKCKVIYSTDVLVSRWTPVPDKVLGSLDKLESYGYPRRLEYYMLSPLWLNGMRPAKRNKDLLAMIQERIKE